MKGSDLRDAIENGLSRLPAAAGRFPQVSGMTIEYDPQRPPGSRMLVDHGRRRAARSQQDLPDRDQRFHGARQRRLCRASPTIKPLVPPDDTPLLANEVMVYLRELGTVRTGVDGRMLAK